MMRKKTADCVPASDWQPIVSGNAQLTLSAVSAARGPALQMAFDFKGGGGFVVARRVCQRAMPKEYAVHFRLRGRAPVNDLELKLLDTAGQNVWRYVMKGLRIPARWKRFTVPSRDIDFAWGPASGSDLSTLGSVEIAIVAGEGGQGKVWLADLTIEDCTPREAPRANASSALQGFAAAGALTDSGWKPRSDDLRPWLEIDFIQPRTVGGLIIDWLQDAPADGFRIRASMSGRRFKTVHAASRAGGRRSYVYLPALKARFLRLELASPSAGAVVRVQPFEFSRSIHAFWNHIAAAEARGWHPRWLHREQSQWTPIGTSDGTRCALMNEDGMVEVDQGSFSIEPMLWIKGRLFTWAEVSARQELSEGFLPVPAVIWESEDWCLGIHAEATVSGQLRLRYRLENRTGEAQLARLFVLLRPFQVTPPWQQFRNLGGVSPIHGLAWAEGAVRVNESLLIVPMSEAGFGALGFDEGFMASRLFAGALPKSTQAQDEFGFATGALEFEVGLQAHQCCERGVTCRPLGAADLSGEAAFDWRARLPASQWSGHGWIAQVLRAALTATAHILVTRSGPALQPGPRRYTRSWIRDGAMMGAALLRMGHAEEVREFIRWYAPYQREDGFVPCCVDGEGADWLVEHDSHGQLLALIADYHRFSADDRFLEESWMFIDRAVGCLEHLIGPDGMLPVSVSHEGYLAQPVHSYWDDFWALRGVRDAAALAQLLGRHDAAQRWQRLSARLAAALYESIEDTRARRKLDFIPGSIEWADFDPTATANAIYLHDVPAALNREALDRTFEKYLADWRNKRSGAVAWANYTPYEIRIIGALVRLGRRDAALELLRFFLQDRRPPPWNQWPEIAWHDRKAPAHLGDLPHTWIAAEYVLAVRSLFAYEREADQSLVLAAGLAPEWLDGEGVKVDAMPTARGPLSYCLRRLDAATLRFEIGGAVTGRLVLRPPLSAPLRGVRLNGSPSTSFDADSVTVLKTPADVYCTTA